MRTLMTGRSSRWWLLLPLAFLTLFFIYPLVEIFCVSLTSEGGFSLNPFETVLSESFFLGRLWFTTWQAAVSTVLTLALGLPSAYLFARYSFPGKTVLKALTTVPFVMPTIVVAVGFMALIGPDGVVNNTLQSLFGLDEPPLRMMNTVSIILLAHVFYNYTVVVRSVSALWANVDPRTEEVARTLGAGPLRVFWHVTLPQIAPAIVSAALLVFLFSFTSFGVVLILGGLEFATIEVTIYNLTARLFRLPTAAALSLVQMTFTLLVMITYARLQERHAVPLSFQPQAAAARRPRGRGGWTFLIANLVLMLVVVLAPLLALVERSFHGVGGYTLAHYEALEANPGRQLIFTPLHEALANSLQFAVVTVAIAVPMGTIIAFVLARWHGRGRALADGLLMLPLGVSAVTLAFGILIGLDQPPLDLRAHWMILVIAHVLISYPFVVRSVLAVARGIDIQLREAAMMLGASPVRVFRSIDLPIASRAILVGATFAFAFSMGDFGASVLLARPEFSTLPVTIFRFLSQPGAERLGAALAMSAVLMGMSAIGFMLIERFRYRDIGEF